MQAPAPFCSRHSAFRPHGDGKHGDDGGVRSVTENIEMKNLSKGFMHESEIIPAETIELRGQWIFLWILEDHGFLKLLFNVF